MALQCWYSSLLLSCALDRGALLSVCLCERQREDVTRLALECLAHLLQRFEVDAKGLPLLQTPKGGVANTSLFSQPIEGPAVLCQQLVYPNFNHKCFHAYYTTYHIRSILSICNICCI